MLRLRLPIGRFFGIGVYIHWSFFLLPIVVLIAMSYSSADSSASMPFVSSPLFGLMLLGAVFCCVVMHEYGHALTARMFGIGTRDITLYPIGGIARLEKMSENPIEEIIIAVAGPAVNVAIVLVLFVALMVTMLLSGAAGSFESTVQSIPFVFFALLTIMNIMLIVFNMMPAFPMDGGRVFRAFLALFMDRLHATRVAVRVGVVMAILIAVVGVFVLNSFLVPIVAVFVFFAGQMELRYLEWKRYTEQQEPLQVRPVRSASFREGPTSPPAWFRGPPPPDEPIYRPNIVVHTWDEENGEWVRDTYSQE